MKIFYVGKEQIYFSFCGKSNKLMMNLYLFEDEKYTMIVVFDCEMNKKQTEDYFLDLEIDLAISSLRLNNKSDVDVCMNKAKWRTRA